MNNLLLGLNKYVLLELRSYSINVLQKPKTKV